MQEQQWCTGCFSLVSSSILYEKHSLTCPFKDNIKYPTSSNPNAVNRLPVLNRYPNNEELFKMVVALTDNLNKANKTISALKRKINLRSNKIDVLEYLNDNVLPTVTIERILSQPLQIYDEETIHDDSSGSENDEPPLPKNYGDMDSISLDTFYDIGFYSFVIQCLSAAVNKYKSQESTEDPQLDETDSSSLDIDDIDKLSSDMNKLDIDNEENESEINTHKNCATYIPPILCFKQKKDIVYIYENNCWSNYTISELTVNNVFNRFACIVHSEIMKLFGNFKSRHEKELYDADFQVILSKRLKCICAINMDQENIVTKIIKPWCNSQKLDLYDFMNCN